MLIEKQDRFSFPKHITVSEVGPRDGLQNEKTRFTIEQKVELIEGAVEAGAKIIEIGSFVSPKAIPQMADTDQVAHRMKRVEGVEYRALITNLKGLERAEAAGIKKAKLTVSASRAHSISNLNRTPEEVLRSFEPCAEYAAAHGITLSGAISTAFGCSMEGRVPFEQVLTVIEGFVAIGVSELSLSDPTGMASPGQVYAYSKKVLETYPDMIWNLHFHNTRGMGLANVLAGLQAGIDRYDASFAGLGGCPYAPGATGNIATEDLLHMCEEMGIETGYDLDRIIALGKRIQQILGKETASFILKAGKSTDLYQQVRQ